MYSIEDELIKSPVISTALKADNDFRGWLTANDYSSIKDKSGLPWTLSVDCVQIPDGVVRNRSQWQIKLQVTTALNGKSLKETGVLSAEEDSRLLELFGNGKIEIKLQPLYYLAQNLEESRRIIAQKVQSVRAHFETQDFYSIKRSLVERRIDEARFFA
jgi:hypothetical protein